MEIKEGRPFSRLVLLLKPDSAEIRNIYLYAIVGGLISLSLPLGIQAIINFIQGGAISTSWMVLVFLVALGVAITGFIQINQLRVTENLQQKIFVRVAFDFVYSVPRIKLEALMKKYTPELVNRFFDVLTIQKGLTKLLLDFSSAIIQVFFGLLLLSFYHSFFIGFSIVIVFLVVLYFRYTSKKGLETSILESNYKYKIAHWIQELAHSSTTFRMRDKYDLPLVRVNALSEKYLSAREDHFAVLKKQYVLMVVFKVIVVLALLLIGGLLVIDQQMNIGQFVASEIVILLIINSAEKLMLSFETIYDVFTGLEKIGKVLDLPLEEEVKNRSSLSCFSQLELKDLKLTENGSVLNLVITGNQSYLITGSSALERGQVLSTLAGIHQFESGKLLVDQMPINQYNLNSYRRLVGYYFEDDRIFEGTVLANLRLEHNPDNESHAYEVLELVGLKKWLQGLPKGLYQPLNPNGYGLCQEMKDRLLIARALMGSPCMVVLESPLQSLDIKERASVINRIIAKKKYALVISGHQDLYQGVNFNYVKSITE